MKFLCRTSVPRQKSENAKDSHVGTGQVVCPSRFPSAFVCVVGQKVVGVRPSSFPKHRHGLLFRSAAPLSSRKSLAGGRDQVKAGGCCDNVKPTSNLGNLYRQKVSLEGSISLKGLNHVCPFKICRGGGRPRRRAEQSRKLSSLVH